MGLVFNQPHVSHDTPFQKYKIYKMFLVSTQSHASHNTHFQKMLKDNFQNLNNQINFFIKNYIALVSHF